MRIEHVWSMHFATNNAKRFDANLWSAVCSLHDSQQFIFCLWFFSTNVLIFLQIFQHGLESFSAAFAWNLVSNYANSDLLQFAALGTFLIACLRQMIRWENCRTGPSLRKFLSVWWLPKRLARCRIFLFDEDSFDLRIKLIKGVWRCVCVGICAVKPQRIPCVFSTWFLVYLCARRSFLWQFSINFQHHKSKLFCWIAKCCESFDEISYQFKFKSTNQAIIWPMGCVVLLISSIDCLIGMKILWNQIWLIGWLSVFVNSLTFDIFI